MANQEYLTQALLAERLAELFPGDTVVTNRKIQGSGCNGRPDFYFPEKALVVEFDGYQHYCQSKTMLRDADKDRLLKSAGIRIVRVPYFIQWCSELVLQIHPYCAEKVVQSYPHGFVDSKAATPADFCELGVARFTLELEGRLEWAKGAIIARLKDRARTEDSRLLLPPSLSHWLN